MQRDSTMKRIEALEAHTSPLGRNQESAARLRQLLRGHDAPNATSEERSAAARICELLALGETHAST